MRKMLVLDCDGVIYPLSDIPHSEFLGALYSALESLGISRESFKEAMAQSRAEAAYGIFNFALRVCRDTGASFDEFCRRFVGSIDYSNVKPNPRLFKLLKQVNKKYDMAIFTNNHIMHLNKILDIVFSCSADTIGFKCFDITSTYKDGVFHPKKSEQGLLMVAEQLGLPPSECILIDDDTTNCNRAREIGMEAVQPDENLSLEQYLCSLLD